MFDPKDHTNIATIGGGAAAERFDIEMQRALENIADINTPWKKPREVTIKVKLLPNEDRNNIAVDIESSVKLAGFETVGSRLFVGRAEGKFVAIEHNPQQLQLDLDKQNAPVPLQSVSNGSDGDPDGETEV